MLRHRIAAVALTLAVAGAPSTVLGQGRPDPGALISAQQKAMGRFDMMDGVWRGPATIMGPSGERQALTQTERVGPFLDGALKVIEGRGYADDGSVAFNALGIISYDPGTKTYTMRSYTQGRAGDFAITPTESGFQWEIPAGPMKIRYTAEISDGTWKEMGERIPPGGEAVQFFEMTLTRVGDSDWPSAGAAGPK